MSISQKGIDAIDLDHVSWHTDKKNLEDSYYLVKHFPDFPLWEYRIASFKYVKAVKNKTWYNNLAY